MALQEAGVRLVAEGASQFQNQLDRASNGVDRFGKNANDASSGIDLMSVATVALGSALGDLALRGLDLVTNSIGNFIQSGFSYNKSIESATAQLVAFTGSQEAAAEALDLVERKAASTPFAFDEMAQSAASLAATSRSTGEELEGLLDLATRLAASNPAEGLSGAAFALREAFSGDFMSLQERFNISKDTVARLKEMGVTTANLSDVFNELGITTGLVTGLAETFDGRMSTLIDTVTKLAGAFTAPIFDLFSGWIADVQIGLDENIVSWQTWATNAGQIVADMFQTAKEAWNGEWVDDATLIMPIHRFVGNAVLLIRKMWDKIVEVGTIAAPIVTEFWNTQVREIEGLQKAWEPFNRVLETSERLFSSLGTLAGTLKDVLFGVEENTGKANKQFARANSLGDTMARFFNSIASAIERIAAVIDQVAAGIERAVSAAGGSFNGLLVPDAPASNWGNTPDTAPSTWGDTPDTAPGGAVSPIPPPNKASSPRTASGGGMVNRNNVVINAPITIPAGVSPSTATKIVTDGVLAAQRSRGMA